MDGLCLVRIQVRSRSGVHFEVLLDYRPMAMALYLWFWSFKIWNHIEDKRSPTKGTSLLCIYVDSFKLLLDLVFAKSDLICYDYVRCMLRAYGFVVSKLWYGVG
ncbi:hypothetical protein U1Q18_052620 [Sarracenia purpurea var. burkii]